MKDLPGIPDCFYNELRFDPLRPFRKEQKTGKGQHTVLRRQVHVPEQPQEIIIRLRIREIIDTLQKGAKPELIKVINTCLRRQLISMNLAGTLKNQTAHPNPP